MESIKIRSTSSASAITDDIVLRETKTTRLIFRPIIINNSKEQEASVKGTFISQKKGPKESWEDYYDLSLSKLRTSEWSMLNFKGIEILKLFRGLSDLYQVYHQEGIPWGEAKYIKVNQGLGVLLTANEDELNQLFDEETADVTKLFSRLLNWLSSIKTPGEVLNKLEELDITNLQAIRSIAGLSALKASLVIWNQNKENSNEEFWQKTLEENSFVLSQIFAYPVIVVKGKAYVGGKSISNSGGNLVDFLAKNDISKNAVLIEIKTPTTQLLNGQYRSNAYSISTDLSGAIVQVANYKNSLQNEYHNLVDSKDDLDAFEPRCLVIAGNYSKEIGRSSTKKKSLDLFRSHLKEIEIITYDELFGKIQFLVNLLEGESHDYVPSKEDDFDVPF